MELGGDNIRVNAILPGSVQGGRMERVIRHRAELLGSSTESVLNEELRRGQRKVFEARDSFHFRTIGNAAGLQLTVNQIPVASLGQDGEVLHDRIFDRAWVEQHQPESRSHP